MEERGRAAGEGSSGIEEKNGGGGGGGGGGTSGSMNWVPGGERGGGGGGGIGVVSTNDEFKHSCIGIPGHPRTLLNNTAQQYGYTLSYHDSWTGPHDKPQWTSVVYGE
jgi:hypothetical protein